MPLQMMITQSGLDALVNAQNGSTDPIMVASVGITPATFVMAPTITSLPGETKRLTAVSGQSSGENVIHMTAQDASEDVYALRGIGLYLADETLFAIYGQATPIFEKVSIAAFLLALDIAFVNGVAGDIIFGDAIFLLPPASETVKGVAEIADDAEADAGADDSRIMSPVKVKRVLDALRAALTAEKDADLDALAGGFDAIIAALIARTITGSGLVSGGGDLSASRTLSVLAASTGDVVAGTATDRAVTPASLADGLQSLGSWSASPPYFRVAGTPIVVQIGEHRGLYTLELPVSITLPFSFPNACLYVGPIGYISADASLRDMFVQMRERSQSGFSVYIQGPDGTDNRLDGFDWIAIGY